MECRRLFMHVSLLQVRFITGLDRVPDQVPHTDTDMQANADQPATMYQRMALTY